MDCRPGCLRGQLVCWQRPADAVGQECAGIQLPALHHRTTRWPRPARGSMILREMPRASMALDFTYVGVPGAVQGVRAKRPVSLRSKVHRHGVRSGARYRAEARG